MLPGLRVSLEAAERNLRIDYEARGPKYGDPEGYRRSAALVILSHTHCGAIEAALSNGTDNNHGSSGVAPLVNPIRRRLTEYLREHPDPKRTDEHLAHAAEVNAIAACLDVVTTNHPDALRIREMVLDRRVALVPARYSLKRGMIQYFEPLTGEHVQRLAPVVSSMRQV